MTVILSDEAARFVAEQVRAGHFPSAEAAVDAAVSNLQRSTSDDDPLAELRAMIAVGLAEADRGEFVEFTAEDVIAERRAARLSRQAGPP